MTSGITTGKGVGSGELDAIINDSRDEAQVVRSSIAVANSIA
jgi:hypothetical protein